jgi:alpha-galactosidase
VANPARFPDGFAAVTAYIHSLGLKSGLYTAKVSRSSSPSASFYSPACCLAVQGPTTCDGFAASCNHEAVDAKQWASWGIDYVRSDCTNADMIQTHL